MALYDFKCPEGHVIEKRTSIDTDVVSCPTCGLPAVREAVYRDQSIFGETVAKSQRRAEVPRGERRYGKKFELFQEASQEIAYAAIKVEQETGQVVKTPNYYKQGLRKANRIKAGLEAPV